MTIQHVYATTTTSTELIANTAGYKVVVVGFNLSCEVASVVTLENNSGADLVVMASPATGMSMSRHGTRECPVTETVVGQGVTLRSSAAVNVYATVSYYLAAQ